MFKKWKEALRESALKPKQAAELYSGPLWKASMEVWGIVRNRVPDARLWVLSAGHGLIAADSGIVPYDITFQESKAGVPSLFSKAQLESGPNSRRSVSQRWWQLLTESNSKKPSSIRELLANSNQADFSLFVIGKDYLDAVFDDLKEGIRSAPDPSHIAVISNNVDDPLAKQLRPHWLHASSRFVNLKGANSTLVNPKIAKELLWHMFEEGGGLGSWSLAGFDGFLKKTSDSLDEPIRPIRTPSSDEDVTDFIRESLKHGRRSFTNLHRKWRDSGRACEYTRFRELFNQIRSTQEPASSVSKGKLLVQHEPRKARMLFFLPDWDDRVDPEYNFESDTTVSERDPYSHDAYHYELYGRLNCDGILVSKSVLEANPQKRLLAAKVGIHKYLRLPRNVPVFGDCGAFSYAEQEEPPFETEETARFYEELGFDYGVSIDHLIFQGMLTKTRCLRWDDDRWQKIDKASFDRLSVLKSTLVVTSKGAAKRLQLDLFKYSEIVTTEEYLDERERNRRYELTIGNARQFLVSHRRNAFSYVPIGAVQGWDAASYAEAVRQYQDFGYGYIALGGLVRSRTSDILNILEAVNRVRKKGLKIHVFGVGRINAIKPFLEMGVSSVDNAGVLRQAWLSTSSNYYSPDFNHFTALRVPAPKPLEDEEDEKPKVVRSVPKRLIQLEQDCLRVLRAYDSGQSSVKEALSAIEKYQKSLGVTSDLLGKYERTLVEKPWKKCPCLLCKTIGIEILVFRGNNRNRRRGFHNTWVFYNHFRILTDGE